MADVGAGRIGRLLSGTETQLIADRHRRFGPVQRVEMEAVDAMGHQRTALLDGEIDRRSLARLRVFQSGEAPDHRGWKAGTAFGRKIGGAFEIGHGQNAGDDRRRDPQRPGPVAEP